MAGTRAPHPGRPERGMGHYLRDLVYGAIDGVITTLAVVAGASGAGFPSIVAVALGLANLAADGISMGASNYLGLKSELEQAGASVAAERPLRHGAATFVAFVAAGAVPLLAYAVPPLAGATPFLLASGLGGVTLAAVGVLRAQFVGKSAWRSAGEMVLVGGAAALAAFLVGAGVERGLAG